jgi:IclR family transcriptional regulator, KDG regulon repressor
MWFDNYKFPIKALRQVLMEQPQKNNRKLIASVQHALNILNLFDASHPELGNSEIANLLSMDPGTVAGLVYTLKQNNYLDQNPSNRKYRLGLKLAERAAVLLNQIDLRKIAAPYLEELRTWSGESTNLAIYDHQEVAYIERLFGSHPLGIRSEIGKRAPLHSTALGKIILANLKTQDVQKILSDYKFTQVTPNTIIGYDDFIRELDHVRKLGFALDNEENEIGGRCLAAPVLNNEEVAVAAISISFPTQRLPLEKIPEYGEKIKTAALEISKRIGFRGDSFPKEVK